jgi:protein-L-isoaspartate O-methyltransferase
LPERILIFIKKLHYARKLKCLDENAEPDLKIVRYLVSDGDQVIDIGANIGMYAAFFSKIVGTEGRVYSFEPVPQRFQILRSNIRRLSLKNVQPVNCAISASNGLLRMEVPSYESGGKN